jgi:hypothetical protein
VPGNNPTGYKMTNVSDSMDKLTRLSEKSCPLYGKVVEQVLANDNLIKARDYFYQHYQENMLQMVNWSQLTKTDFDNTCEYIFFSQYDPQLKLNFTVSEH